MVLSAMSNLRIALVVIGGLVAGCGQHRAGGMAGRMTTEEFVEAVKIMTSDWDCRDTRLKAYWGFGWVPKELADAVLGRPISTSSLKPDETLNIYRTSNGTVSLQVWAVDGLPPDAPQSLRLQFVNQISTRPQSEVDRERLKSQILAIKLRFDPADSGALAAEMREEAIKKAEQAAASDKYWREESQRRAVAAKEDHERRQAAEQAEFRRMSEERARESAERQEQGRDASQADRDYVTLRDKISNRDLGKKFSDQYLDWYKRRAAHLGEQRRLGLDRRSVPLPSIAAIEMAIQSGTGPVPVGE